MKLFLLPLFVLAMSSTSHALINCDIVIPSETFPVEVTEDDFTCQLIARNNVEKCSFNYEISEMGKLSIVHSRQVNTGDPGLINGSILFRPNGGGKMTTRLEDSVGHLEWSYGANNYFSVSCKP